MTGWHQTPRFLKDGNSTCTWYFRIVRVRSISKRLPTRAMNIAFAIHLHGLQPPLSPPLCHPVSLAPSWHTYGTLHCILHGSGLPWHPIAFPAHPLASLGYAGASLCPPWRFLGLPSSASLSVNGLALLTGCHESFPSILFPSYRCSFQPWRLR